ncbi:MAG: hypothetical protein QHC40_12230 [Sphingobium sp.]|nr:hypothetical protein [Sphingobium sp.]
MNDRNAFLQGQGSPIKDDEPPPTQGWRGEKAATQTSSSQEQRRPLNGTDIEVEEVSGTAFAESMGLQPPPDEEAPDAPAAASSASSGPAVSGPATHSDGVSDRNEGAGSTGGESGGAPYPNPHDGQTSENDFGSTLGHGGQTEIAYHGPGHLGEKKVGDDDNRNGVAESND